VGEILHIDIFSTDKKHFLTCLDKLSKFAVVQPIASRTIIDIQSAILQLLNFFRRTKTIHCDNEPAIKSETIRTLKQKYDIQAVNAPPLHSTSNGQVERFHSTLSDNARCLTAQRKITNTIKAILQATIEYNRTVHSVTDKRPMDIIHSSPPELDAEIRDKILKAQQIQMKRLNEKRQERNFQVGDTVLLKANKRS